MDKDEVSDVLHRMSGFLYGFITERYLGDYGFQLFILQIGKLRPREES